jgi:biotin carboxyl carrier protein
MSAENVGNGSENGSSRQPASMTYQVELESQTVVVTVIDREDGRYIRVADDAERRVEVVISREDGELGVLVGGELVRGLVGHHADGVTVALDGHSVNARVVDERAARLASAAAAGRPRQSETAIRAPMPGLVVGIPVEVGQTVTKGTTLVVLSAMKMQNELTAPSDGVVKEVLVSTGQTVDQRQVLVRLE